MGNGGDKIYENLSDKKRIIDEKKRLFKILLFVDILNRLFRILIFVDISAQNSLSYHFNPNFLNLLIFLQLFTELLIFAIVRPILNETTTTVQRQLCFKVNRPLSPNI